MGKSNLILNALQRFAMTAWEMRFSLKNKVKNILSTLHVCKSNMNPRLKYARNKQNDVTMYNCYKKIQRGNIKSQIYWLRLHKVLTYVEYRAVPGVFQNIDPPPPSPPSECVLTPAPKAGGGEGGVNSLEDASHRIGLLQSNLSKSHELIRVPRRQGGVGSRRLLAVVFLNVVMTLQEEVHRLLQDVDHQEPEQFFTL